MKRLLVGLVALTATSAVLITSSVAGANATPESWLLQANGNSLPPGIAAKVQAAGGTLTDTIPQVGIAVASSTSSTFQADAAKIAGLRSVTPNLTIDWLEPEFTYPPTSGDDDIRFDLQWGHIAVDSVGAWNAGYRGDAAKIAVLDTGFNLTHTDLAPNIVGSTNMTPQGPANGQWALNPSGFSHGTHVAGIAAAPDNAIGTIGIAPQADLLLVKVLEDTGSGSFDDVIEGIVYAADQDADVINMSLGGTLLRRGEPDLPPPDAYTAKDAAELANAIGSATTYAFQQGTTVIASAGNAASDADHTADLLHLPSDAPHVSSIAATAPIGWALGPGDPYWDGSFDHPASYTNFGQSVIDFAAPGGDAAYPGNENCLLGGLVRPCWVFDLVFAPGTGGPGVNGFFWAGGTSMAAPHATAVAAIIIGKNGGSMNPAQVVAAMRASADDIGKPGNDDFSGAGRVNAANAVG